MNVSHGLTISFEVRKNCELDVVSCNLELDLRINLSYVKYAVLVLLQDSALDLLGDDALVPINVVFFS